MNREINTIGSKANDAVISREVVTLKLETGKISRTGAKRGMKNERPKSPEKVRAAVDLDFRAVGAAARQRFASNC